MRAIVVVDKVWGIGKGNDLLFSLPADMKHFRETTAGKVVVMGSNTLLSFPGGKPLKNRTNIVLWPDGPQREDCTGRSCKVPAGRGVRGGRGDDVSHAAAVLQRRHRHQGGRRRRRRGIL